MNNSLGVTGMLPWVKTGIYRSSISSTKVIEGFRLVHALKRFEKNKLDPYISVTLIYLQVHLQGEEKVFVRSSSIDEAVKLFSKKRWKKSRVFSKNSVLMWIKQYVNKQITYNL